MAAWRGKEKTGAVDICSSEASYKDLYLLGGQARKYILVENTVASNAKEAQEIVRFTEENDVKLQVGHMVRFNTGCREIKRPIDESELWNTKVLSTMVKLFLRASFLSVAPAEPRNGNIISA
jgi:predicted dehydrogenase